MKLFCILSLIITFLACGEQKTEAPSNLIPEDALIALLADFHLMDAAAKQNVITNNHKNLVKHKQYLGILKKHGFSRAQFDSTIQYNIQYPEVFKKLYDDVGTYLKLEQEKHQEAQKHKK